MLDPYPPAAFSFKVRILPSGLLGDDTSFQEAGGIGPEMEVESYREGGENRFVHSLPKGVKHPKLSLKRGIARMDSPLVNWCHLTLDAGLAVRIVPQMVLLYLQDEAGLPLRAWSFEGAYPTKWSVDPFQADKNGVAIEKIELSYAVSLRTL